MYTVTISEVLQDFGLINFLPQMDLSRRVIRQPKINRPALQMTGFFQHFDGDRMQIIGFVEHSYLSRMDETERTQILKKFFSYNIPCLVLCRSLAPFPEMLALAEKNNTPLLGCDESTTDFISEILRWLKVQLAPRITMHGVMVDVYGEGLLITGESGIGKSEMALELIKRGHRLVADDAVEVKRVSKQTLIGSCPENIRFFIEVRGIGIIDVRQTFGVQSIKITQNIDLVLRLEEWNSGKTYDRLGLDTETTEILGNHIPIQTIPIRPGRNLAMIGEAAAVNHRQKKMGYSAALALTAQLKVNSSK
ncbi:MAG: HPr(Ser) kinase/phosphatase [Defluviitaleaceae bacterium]|nr:HPr(Ser) kinase/phosphatase [Defluviitaleaceae bacterium]